MLQCLYMYVCRFNKRRGSFTVKPLNSNATNGGFVKPNPSIPMDVISVGTDSNL